MSDEIKETYSPGLAGVIAGESAICWVDPDSGLLYRGYDIHELAKQSSFEEVTWLLLHGEPASSRETQGIPLSVPKWMSYRLATREFSHQHPLL